MPGLVRGWLVDPGLVARDFTAAAPGEKMVGDITYIPTWEVWVFLATVIDCYTKAVIGWAMDDHYRTPLISAAIPMAARNHNLKPMPAASTTSTARSPSVSSRAS